MVLHANMQSEMVLTIFTIFFFFFFWGGGGGAGNHIQQLIIFFQSNYNRNKRFAVLKLSGNHLFQTWYVKRIYPL